MKKLYNEMGKKIRPSPPSFSPCDLLSYLPAAILALTEELSPEDKEVLAYLLCGAVTGKKNNQQHPPELGCGCFECYKSFWARWDASRNRFLIHYILDAVEGPIEPLAVSSDRRRCHRRRRFNSHKDNKKEFFAAEEGGRDEGVEEEDFRDTEEEDEEWEGEEEEKEKVAEDIAMAGDDSSSSVRGFISLLGDKIWGVWNQ